MNKEPLYQQPPHAIKACKHGRFLYNLNDTFIAASLHLYGEWCEAELELLAPYVPSGGLVLDIGANIGTHAVAFAKMVGRAGHVLAFEPQRLIFYMLCANAALNELAQLYCLRMAVGDKAGKARIPFRRLDTPFNYGALSLLDNGKAQEVAEAVDCTTVDALRLAKCDLMKIDVEGYEEKVLHGAAETIRRLRPVLFVENDRPEFSPGVYTTLAEFGYSAFWHIAPYYREGNFFGSKENLFAPYMPQPNVLCFHKNDTRLEKIVLPVVEGPQQTWEDAWKKMQGAK